MISLTRRCLYRFLEVCVLVLLTSALYGCATPSGPPPLPDEPLHATITDPAARRQLQQGKPLAASDIYSRRAARTNDPAQQQDYLLIAAEILFDRALAEPGKERLAAVPELMATAELGHRRAILVAKDQISDRNAQAALAALPDPFQVENPLHRARLYEARAQAYNILQDPDNELIARIELENQLSDDAIVQKSHEQIWQLLTTQPLSTMRRMTTNVRGDIYQGWIELALAHAAAGIDDTKRRSSIADWQGRFPVHPANPNFVDALYAPSDFDINIDGKPINQIAVLLPLSGSSTAAVAAAIRDGIVAASYQQSQDTLQTPLLRFYDVGDNPGYVRTAYQNAINDGADAIIGPLRKQAVAAVVSQREVPVPTLTLNNVESTGLGGSTNNVIQFGLAPEDEARAAASRATALSLKNAIILQADDSRGDREARAFQDAMYLYGGDVVHIEVLPKDQYDYSEQIKEALAITKSDVRFKTLSRTIGEKLFFEPSIRNDVDVIFLAITSEQARSVRPQLDFFHARGVIRLGTSRVASLDDDAKKNKDLNTIYYPDAPWVLRESLSKDPLRNTIIDTFSGAQGAYAKLYALGADSYQLITSLNELGRGARLNGYTGGLELSPEGRINRYLDWAQYVDGVSETVESIEAPALPSIRSSVIN